MYVGVVEGFYGPLWDKIDRLLMIEFMQQIGLNIYIYGPKWDPYHRSRWRTPYPRSYIDMFTELIDAGNRKGVEIVYALSPGLTINYSDKNDRRQIILKLEGLMEIGFTNIAIFLDDIPPVLRGKGYKTLGEAQADLVNYVIHELSPKNMFFCPTYYWGFREDYLRELGSLLENNVYIMWTGPAIVSRKIRLEDVKRFHEITGRKPFIWDNYPVNDYFLLKGIARLHLGPFTNREPEIWNYVSGYVANPMIEAEASKIPLYTLAKMYRRKQNYDPEESITNAIKHLYPEEYYETMRLFIELNKASPFNPLGDYVPSKNDVARLKKMLYEINNINNKKLLEETSWIISKLQTIIALLEGQRIRVEPRIQTAGDYDPLMNDEEMKFFFGEVIEKRRIWI